MSKINEISKFREIKISKINEISFLGETKSQFCIIPSLEPGRLFGHSAMFTSEVPHCANRIRHFL